VNNQAQKITEMEKEGLLNPYELKSFSLFNQTPIFNLIFLTIYSVLALSPEKALSVMKISNQYIQIGFSVVFGLAAFVSLCKLVKDILLINARQENFDEVLKTYESILYSKQDQLIFINEDDKLPADSDNFWKLCLSNTKDKDSRLMKIVYFLLN
jgi:hypothetical protein